MVEVELTMAAASTHPVTMVITKVAQEALTRVGLTKTLKLAISTGSIKINA